jgi:hypothetical protein
MESADLLTPGLRATAVLSVARVFALTPIELTRRKVSPVLLTRAREGVLSTLSGDVFEFVQSRFPEQLQWLCELSGTIK